MTHEPTTILLTTLLVGIVAILANNRRTTTPLQQVHISVPTQEASTRWSMVPVILLGINIILLVLHFGPALS